MSSDASPVPVLDTPRLRLRGHRAEDLPRCVGMWADPDVVRFIGAEPASEQRTWARLLAYVGHWALMGYGYWAVEERGSGEFVGEVGLADFRRDIAAPMRGSPELGFALVPRFHGKGYATECVRAVLAWSDVHLSYRRTVCLIDPRNLASLHVVEKCGYEAFGQGTHSGRAALFLERWTHAAPE